MKMELLCSKSSAFAVSAVVLCLLQSVKCALINGRYPYYIVEELPAKTLIGNVANDAKLNAKYSTDVYKNLTFNFAPGSNTRELFLINKTNSIFSTAVKIDRDAICKNALTCYIELDIIVGPDQYHDVIQIIVDIMDINDNAPTFPQDEISFEITEGLNYGKIFQIPLAVDPDSRPNSIQSYQLVPKNKLFKLHVNTISSGAIVDLRLEVLTQFDYELANVYQLKIIAYDGGSPGMFGYMMVNFKILDRNDNLPQFSSRTYEVFVSESISLDTVVAKVGATDLDSGDFGLVTYRFSDTSLNHYGNTFDINLLNGDVILIGPIDYEMTNLYNLEILAIDEVASGQTSTATLIIQVIDTNDWVPHIVIDTSQPDGKASVMENAKLGTAVAYITVTDKDSGLNGQTGCQMETGLFAVVKTDFGKFKVVTSGRIDREQNESVSLVIKCFDYGDPPNEVSTSLEVNIEDSNDNAPVFEKQIFQIQISENNPVGASIVEVKATDVDKDENGHVMYYLQEEYQKIFNINPSSGLITAKISFDREQSAKIKFLVYGKDNGDPPHSSSATVILTITDLDDSLPEFTSSSYSFGVYENENPRTLVGSVTADDLDNPPFNTFIYQILKENDTAVPFTIDENDGKIMTTAILDREQVSAYYFTVVAKDVNEPIVTSSASVTIYVADKNDNHPDITWPNYQDKSLTIPINAPVGLLVTQVQADDKDLGDNGRLTYKITDGDFSSYFHIHEKTGVITVVKSLYGFKDREYVSLLISVQDNGHVPQTVSTTVDIFLNSTNIETFTILPDITTPGDNTVESENLVQTEKDNKVVIVTALSSVSLLLVFVIILALFFLRKMSFEKGFRGQRSASSFGVNPIVNCKDYDDKLEDEC